MSSDSSVLSISQLSEYTEPRRGRLADKIVTSFYLVAGHTVAQAMEHLPLAMNLVTIAKRIMNVL